MAVSIYRKTERYVGLPIDLGLTVEKRYSAIGTRFRVARALETVTESTDSKAPPKYTVRLDGPVVTKSGKDHETQHGEVEYGWQEKLADLPDAVKPYLVGPEALTVGLDVPLPKADR